MDSKAKPGTPAKQSGQAVPVGPRGGRPTANEVTVVRGKTLPPTPKPNQTWLIVDRTKHKRVS